MSKPKCDFGAAAAAQIKTMNYIITDLSLKKILEDIVSVFSVSAQKLVDHLKT